MSSSCKVMHYFVFPDRRLTQNDRDKWILFSQVRNFNILKCSALVPKPILVLVLRHFITNWIVVLFWGSKSSHCYFVASQKTIKPPYFSKYFRRSSMPHLQFDTIDRPSMWEDIHQMNRTVRKKKLSARVST